MQVTIEIIIPVFDEYCAEQHKISFKYVAVSGYVKKFGPTVWTRPLSPTCFYLSGFSFFTFGTLKSLGLKHFPELLGRPSSDNPDVLILKPHVNLLCGGVAGAIAQTIS